MLKNSRVLEKTLPKTREARERVLHSNTQEVKGNLDEVATHDQGNEVSLRTLYATD